MYSVEHILVSIEVANIHLAAGRDYSFLLELVNKLSAQLVPLQGDIA